MSRKEGERDFALVRLAVDYAIVRILSEAPTLDDAAPRVLASIGETLGWEISTLWRTDGAVLRCAATWEAAPDRSSGFEQACRGIGFAPGVGLPGRVWASGEPAWIEDLAADHNFQRAHAAAKAGLQCGFAFPIPGREGLLGVVELFSVQSRAPDPELLEMMEVAGRQIGQFIERTHTEGEIRKSEARILAILNEALAHTAISPCSAAPRSDSCVSTTGMPSSRWRPAVTRCRCCCTPKARWSRSAATARCWACSPSRR